MKIVVFDLDETLGYFVELGIFWDCLNNNVDVELTQDDFNDILDLYPEFLRPNIIHILNYLKHKKQSKCCNKMMIYTNNQRPKIWANQIVSYFESKINFHIFDQIIAAFKINGKKIEVCRTSHDKTYSDLVKCTKIPSNSEVCFLDDNYFSGMSNDNVYYINIKPYVHNLKFNDMIERFIKSEIGKELIKENETDKFTSIMTQDFKAYNLNFVNKNDQEYDIDKILGKQIMSHLQIFFNKSLKNKTKKHYINKKNKTKKN
jgi:hypothetical protein